MIATQVPRRLSLLKTSSTRASLVIPAAHWAETTTVPAVGEVLRRDRQETIDHTTRNLDAKIRHRHSAEMRAPRAWWPAPGGVFIEQPSFPESRIEQTSPPRDAKLIYSGV